MEGHPLSPPHLPTSPERQPALALKWPSDGKGNGVGPTVGRFGQMLCMGGAGSGSPFSVSDRFPSEVKGNGNQSQCRPEEAGGHFTSRHR